MPDFCALVVLYKCSVADSSTLQSLLKAKPENLKLVVWDNSPQPLSTTDIDSLQLAFPWFRYQHSPENTSLSSVYNQVYRAETAADYFLLFDQDSTFSATYLHELNEAVRVNRDIHLFAPVVRHDGRIMSPAYYGRFKGSYRKSIASGRNSTRNMSVVMSGICLSMEYLQGCFSGFDERFTFYGIDTFFSVQFRRQNDWFYVLASDFGHSLSHTEIEDYPTRLRRFHNLKNSLTLLTQYEPWWVRVLSFLYVHWLSFVFWIKNRSQHDT